LDAIPVPATVADLEGKILHVNPRCLEALGYAREELVGRDIGTVYGSTLDTEQASGIRQEILEKGWRGEVANIRKDGSVFPVYVEIETLCDTEKNPALFVAVARDITEQRAFQERLLGEARLGTLGLITHNVAHEVRNHLSTIKMCLYMLERSREPTGEEGQHFSIAQEELGRIELFLRNLETSVHPPQPFFHACELVDVVNQGLEEARQALHLKSVSIHRQFPNPSPRIVVDPRQVAQAVAQVVQNAAEAVKPNGSVHLVMKRQPEGNRAWWLIEIRDDGPGVAPHLQDRVFEPFFSTTSHRMGMGLSNVATIMKRHEGMVTLTSHPRRGTTVTLKLPERTEV
jgi:PAS domain S-box-containing protein